MIKLIVGGIVALVAFIGGITLQPQHEPVPNLGVALPGGIAVFETSLQNRISSTDTSMTLVSTSTRGGGSLSGYQCFTIDEGRSDAEYVCGNLTAAKTVSSLERGLDPLTGTTTNSALKFAHRVGANIKITDFPLIQRMRSQLSGTDTISSLIRYETSLTPAAGGDLVDYDYVTGLAFSGAGVIDATNAAKGVVELATGAEAAASTASGSSGPLAIPASLATSTWNPATAANRVLMSGSGGQLSGFFVGTSTVGLWPFTLPVAQGASSTALTATNGTGTTWSAFSYVISTPAVTSGLTNSASTASTTIFTGTIPANTLTPGSVIKIKIPGATYGFGGGTFAIEASYGGTGTSTRVFGTDQSNGGALVDIEYTVRASGVNTQHNFLNFDLGTTTLNGSGNSGPYATSTSAVTASTDQPFYIIVRNVGAGQRLIPFTGYVEALRVQ